MDKQEAENYIEAGKIASEVVRFAKSIIRKGMSLSEIAEKVESKIKELGGEPAFPVNLSLNEIAAHYTPGLKDNTKAEGLLKVDLGVSVNGYIADTAFSIDLSENKEHRKIIELNELVLKNVLAKIKKGSKINEIGNSVQKDVEEYNAKNKTSFSVIRNLTGHSVDKGTIHAGLTIPNYRNSNENILEDCAIAIEPFLTYGIGEVYEGKESEIYVLQSEGNVRDKDARLLLNFIKEKYKTLPFCRRWLEKENFQKLNFSLKILKDSGVIHNYPVLIEKGRQPVSQAEHTLILSDKILITTK